MSKSLVELCEERAIQNVRAALDRNISHTHDRLKSAQMAAALLTCASELRAIFEREPSQ